MTKETNTNTELKTDCKWSGALENKFVVICGTEELKVQYYISKSLTLDLLLDEFR
jgi:hypothetical protein